MRRACGRAFGQAQRLQSRSESHIVLDPNEVDPNEAATQMAPTHASVQTDG
jgi:hypothetical protein